MCIEDFVPVRIMELCSKNGISRYQLSPRTGISQSALSDIVKKKNNPTLATIERICDAFGITIAQFFTVDDNSPDLSEDQAEILCIWNSLKTEEKKFIKTCMNSMKNKI